MDFMHILRQKEAIWNTIFSIFERRRGPPNVAGSGKTFPAPPLDGPEDIFTKFGNPTDVGVILACNMPPDKVEDGGLAGGGIL